MAENNDASVLLFFERKLSITVGIQEVKDRLMGIVTTVVLKRLDENAGSVFFAEALDQLDFGVDAIIVANIAADKTDDNNGGSGRNTCGSSRGLRARLTRDEGQRKKQQEDPERRKHGVHRDRQTTTVQMTETRLKLRKNGSERMVRRSGKR